MSNMSSERRIIAGFDERYTMDAHSHIYNASGHLVQTHTKKSAILVYLIKPNGERCSYAVGKLYYQTFGRRLYRFEQGKLGFNRQEIRCICDFNEAFNMMSGMA